MFSVTSAKRGDVFKASLKVVREEARANSPTRIINVQHPKDQTAYVKGNA